MRWSNSFRGLAHVVVSKIFQSAEPDFVVKTQTAVMGVRGTDFGVRLHPNSSEILNFEGRLQVGNIFPEVSQLFRRAFKVAYSFGSGAGGGNQWVFLNNMQGTTVARGLPPTLPYGLSDQDREMFMHQLRPLPPPALNPTRVRTWPRDGTGHGSFKFNLPGLNLCSGGTNYLSHLDHCHRAANSGSPPPAPTQPQPTPPHRRLPGWPSRCLTFLRHGGQGPVIWTCT